MEVVEGKGEGIAWPKVAKVPLKEWGRLYKKEFRIGEGMYRSRPSSH